MIIVNNENRPDLAVGLSKKALAGAATMIAPTIFPSFPVAEKTGTITCAKVIQGGGTKSRTKGQALSGTRVEAESVTYTCNSYEGRDILAAEDVKDAGGLDNALQAGARGAGYDAIYLLETDAKAALESAFSAASGTAITVASGAPFDALFEAGQDVKYYGKPLLVASESFMRKFVSLPKVSETLTDLFGHGWFKDIHDLGNGNKALGAAFGVDAVVIGEDATWETRGVSAASGDQYAYVVGYREEAQTDARSVVKRLPSLGFMPTYLPEENSTMDEPFAVSTVYLPDVKDSAVDVDLYAVPKVANNKAVAKVKIAG